MGYSIRWEKKGVFVEMEGEVDSTELGHINNRLYADERYDKISFQMLDMSAANVRLSKEEVLEIGTLDMEASRWNNTMRMAFLSPNDKVRELFEKYYIKQMAETEREIEAFESRDEALRWINKSANN